MDDTSHVPSQSAGSLSGRSLGGSTYDGGNLSDDNITAFLAKDRGVRDTVLRANYALRVARYGASWKYSMFVFIIPHIALIGLMMGPQFQWGFTGLLENLRWLDTTYVLGHLGYSMFKGVLFGCAGVVGAVVACIAWLSYQFTKQSTPWAPLVHLLGFFRALVLELFYIPMIAVFLSAVSCDVVDAHIEGRQPFNKIFAGQECFSGMGAIVYITAVLAMTLLMLIALANSIADFDPNVLTDNLLATAESRWSTSWLVLSTLCTISAIVWREEPYIAGIIIAALCAKMVADLLRYEPYYRQHVNCSKAGIIAATGMTGFLLIVSDALDTEMGLPLVCSLPVSFAAGYGSMFWQSRSRQKMADDVGARMLERGRGSSQRGNADMLSPSLRRDPVMAGSNGAWKPHVAEICSRCARIRDEFGNYDESLQYAAESILRMAQEQSPDNASLALAYARFLKVVRLDNAGCLSQMLRVAKMPMSINTRMMYFWMDRDHKSYVRTQGHGSDGSMDLMSFMEFQQSFRAAQKSHTACLEITQRFWRNVARKEVTFKSMADHVRRIVVVETNTMRLYKVLLERYPSSVKVLRSYGKYLEEILCNPWKAMRLYNLADKTEDMAADRKRERLLTSTVDGGGEDFSATVDDDRDGVVCITSTGIIQMTNKFINRFLGYQTGELEGMNVSSIMPPPFSQRHNSYLRAYKATGRGTVVGNTSKMLAMRRDGTVVPVTIKVSKLMEGADGQHQFIGVIRPLTEEETGGPDARMMVWLSPEMSVLCANGAFTSVTGYATGDFQGGDLSMAAPQENHWVEALMKAADALNDMEAAQEQPSPTEEDDDEERAVPEKEINETLVHKFSQDVIPVRCMVRKIGTGQRLMYEVEMEATQDVEGVSVFDMQGRMLYASRMFQKILGYAVGDFPDLRRMSLDKILQAPYAQFHTPLLKAAVLSGEEPAEHIPCFRGHTVNLCGRNHLPVSARLRWWPQRQGNATHFVVSARPEAPSPEAAAWGVISPADLLEHGVRMTMLTTLDGTVVGVGGGTGLRSGGTPGEIFGLSAGDLIGDTVHNVIDVLQLLVQNAQLYSRASPKSTLSHVLGQLARFRAGGLALTTRASLICMSQERNGPDYVPARFSVLPLRSAALDLSHLSKVGCLSEAGRAALERQGGYAVHVWSSNWLTGHVTVARDGTIRQVDSGMEVLTGMPKDTFVGKPLGDVLKGDGLMTAVRKGDVRVPCQAVHMDTSLFGVSATGGTHRARGGGLDTEILVRALFEQTENAVDSLRRMEAMVAKVETTAAPLAEEASPKTLPSPDKSPKRLVSNIGEASAPVTPRKGGHARQVSFRLDIQAKDDDNKRSVHSFKSDTKPAKGAQEGPKQAKSAEAKAPAAKEAERAAPPQKEASPHRDEDANSDAGSTNMGSSVTGTLGHGNMSSHVKRAKRLRRLKKMLEISNAALFAELVNKRFPLFVLLAVAMHTVFFAIYTELILGSRAMVDATRVSGKSTLYAQYVATDTETIQAMYDDDPLHGISADNWPMIRDRMGEYARNLSDVNEMVYIGTKVLGIKSELRDILFETPALEVSVLKDTEPPIRYVQKQGLLSLTERWVQKVLLLLRNDKVLPRMKEDKDFDFVVRNTHAALVPALDDMLLAQASNTVKDMEDLQNVALIIAVIQSLVVVPLFSAAVYMNVARLNGNRSSLFTVFLSIPRHLLVRLATASASPEDAEQAQAAMEDLAMMNGGKQGSLFTWKKPDANLGMDRHTQRRVAYLMIPMVLLVGLVFGLHMASYAAITATGDPARDLVATERLLGETAKIRYWTNQMTVLPWKSELEFARKELLVQVDETELLWKSLLHGNPEMDLTGSVLDDPFQVEIIQGDMCLMEREEDCRDPSDPYHNQVSHGLGVVMGLYFSSARHWVAFEDSAPDDPVNYQDKDSSAQEFIWEVGSKEIADGIARLALRQVQRIYMTLFQVVAIEGVLLAIACGVTLLYIWLLKPYVRATRDEVQRCARMLAMLPSAMDVEGMVTEMLDIHSTELTYQSTASAGMRVYTFCAEGVARCLLGRRFKNLIDMERSTLQQRAAQEKARRTKLEQEMKGGVGGKKG